MMSTLNFTVMLMIAMSSPVMEIMTERAAKSRRWRQVTSIEHSKPDGELRMMACVYTQDNAPSLLNLLDVSYPNKQSPICIYLLHLVELVGRAAPTLGPHKFQQRSSAFQVKFDKIVSIFRNHEKQSDGCVTVQPFVSVSPINTMHLDVCALAAEKRVSIVVVPFYEQLAMDGALAQFRHVAQNIMAEAVCSVGVLIDRGRPNYAAIGWDSSNIYTYHVGIIFLGGQDDREALAYVLRMASHPGTDVTVLRCLGAYDDGAHVGERERLIDERAVGDFRLKTLDNKNVTYKEEVVKNGEDIVVAIRSMRSHFDLVVVGRRHQAHSKIMDELLPWSDYEELGVVGDILAAPDFAKFALTILVVQQSMAAGHAAAKQKEMAVKEHTSETPLTPDINEAEPEPEHSHFSQSHPVIVVEAR